MISRQVSFLAFCKIIEKREILSKRLIEIRAFEEKNIGIRVLSKIVWFHL